MKSFVVKILVSLVTILIVSSAGAVIGITINDAVQDNKIVNLTKSVNTLIEKINDIDDFIRKSGKTL